MAEQRLSGIKQQHKTSSLNMAGSSKKYDFIRVKFDLTYKNFSSKHLINAINDAPTLIAPPLRPRGISSTEELLLFFKQKPHRASRATTRSSDPATPHFRLIFLKHP